jgi:hypothetical protein
VCGSSIMPMSPPSNQIGGIVVVSIMFACKAEDPGQIPSHGFAFIQDMWHASQRGQPTLLPSKEQHSLRISSKSKRLLSAVTTLTAPPEKSRSACSVAVSYKPPVLVTRARLPACAVLVCLLARSATPCFDSRALARRVTRHQPKRANSRQRLTL